MFDQRFLLVFIFLVMCGTSVRAQTWQFNLQKDDFGDKDTAVALIESSGRGFGFRCIKGEPPAAIFLTREQWGDALSLVSAKLLLRIDEGEPLSLEASLESYDGGNAFRQAELVRVVATEIEHDNLMKQIESGKGRLSVAIEIGKDRYEPTRFSVRGSSKALSRLRPYCSS